jgi:hypothetical protein
MVITNNCIVLVNLHVLSLSIARTISSNPSAVYTQRLQSKEVLQPPWRAFCIERPSLLVLLSVISVDIPQYIQHFSVVRTRSEIYRSQYFTLCCYRSVKLISHLQLVPRLSIVEPYLHSPISLHSTQLLLKTTKQILYLFLTCLMTSHIILARLSTFIIS